MTAVPERPARLVAVVGTATEIGKTWVSGELLRRAHAGGASVAARKPVQSFDPAEESTPTDAEVLARATGETAERVCPPHRWYPRAFAPPMAAESLGRPGFTAAQLLDELAWDPGLELGLVETAGGVCSPLADDTDSAGFARALHPDLVVLVADAGLGTINAVRLSLAALVPLEVLVFLNRFDEGAELHRRNRDWLESREGLNVVTDLDAAAKALVSGARDAGPSSPSAAPPAVI